jgi:hypothetical protein
LCTGRAPVPDQEVEVLKALFVGLCALILVTQAAAEANREEATDRRLTAKREHRVQSLQSRLEQKLAVARKQRTVIHFFTMHRWLLSAEEHAAIARKKLAHARGLLARTIRQIEEFRRVLRIRKARLRAAPSPRHAICATFHDHCEEALAVAWCESRLQTDARNGEYLGLFQMGSLARRLFGHGASARKQSVAAHRYFVSSGRDWSPWSCKP